MNSNEIRKEGYLREKHRYFHLRDTAGQERDFHFHDFDKIVIPVSGHVDYAVEDEIYTLRPWDILLVRHHTIHKALIDRAVPYERIIIYLDEDYYTSVLPEAGLAKCFEAADSTMHRLLIPGQECTDEIRNILSLYEKYHEGSGRRAEWMKETSVMQLLILLGTVSTDEVSGSLHRYGGKIEEALSYINGNLNSALSVEDIAGKVYLSKYHFMRLFREATGTTVHFYVRQQRLLRAARLIREGMSASEAAGASGFEDYTAFYRAFRANFGVTPAEFKK